MKAMFLIGRTIFGGFFLYSGINHFQNKEAMTGYAASKQLPQPENAVLASGALKAASGLSVILGVKPRYGLAGIIGFLAIASPSFHDFWNRDEAEAQNDMIHFSKNAALLGAALALASTEEWPLSLA